MPPVRSKRLDRFRVDAAVGGGVWLAFVICCALPLGWMVLALCTTPAAASALHPIAFHLRLLGRTLVYNIGVAVVATLLALPVAIVLGKGRGAIAVVRSFVLPA